MLSHFAVISSFLVPIIILYYLFPESFVTTWKGRTFYMFFVWLMFLETYINWEKLKTKAPFKLQQWKTIPFLFFLVFPTVFIFGLYFLEWEIFIGDLTKDISSAPAHYWSLSFEYIIFTICLSVLLLLKYGVEGLKLFSISTAFVGVIGSIYLLDTMYPYGAFQPFQALVPVTAYCAAQLLNSMGYKTTLASGLHGTTRLKLYNASGTYLVGYDIAWPCAGVHSLILYSLVILLFLKQLKLSAFQKFVCYIVGAIVTFFLNVLRIVSIYLVTVNYGQDAATVFHDYYGELYVVLWTLAYPFLIMGFQKLWLRTRVERILKIEENSVSFKSVV